MRCARSLPSPLTLWLRSARNIGAPQEIIDRIAEEQMYNASMYRNLHTIRKHGANAPEEARRIIEASDLEKELRLRHLEKQREVLKPPA